MAEVTIYPGGGGVLLGILGGGVPPGSPNSDLITDQKMSLSTPVFRPGLCRQKMMSSLLRLERKQKILQTHFEFAYFSFFLIWNWNDKYVHTLPWVLSKTIPDSRPKWAKSIRFSDQGAKTIPFRAAHTYSCSCTWSFSCNHDWENIPSAITFILAFSGQTVCPEVNKVSSSNHSEDLWKKKEETT